MSHSCYHKLAISQFTPDAAFVFTCLSQKCRSQNNHHCKASWEFDLHSNVIILFVICDYTGDDYIVYRISPDVSIYSLLSDKGEKEKRVWTFCCCWCNWVVSRSLA